ncbi:MAG: hypothetical protein Q4G11_00890 [Gallicola sp.]|nr:hypothetical protein [Gallicola sp.]
MFFDYGEKELDYLKAKDKRLGDLIDQVGYLEIPVDKDVFSSVVRHIIGQQISMAAQNTIWERLKEKLGKVSPEKILELTREELQSVGITFKKADYILNFAQKVSKRAFPIEALHEMTDEEVIEELCKIDGIGPWTAEMIMTFSMGRSDIVSFGDLAILRGMRKLYRHRKIDKETFGKYRRRYSPYGSIASFYLWELAEGDFPHITDPGERKRKNKKKDSNR